MGQASTAHRSAPASRAELDDLTVRRAQQGERAALDQLVERYHPMVHALVWRMACARGDSHVADLVQDALIRVLQNIARFDPAGPARLSTWILTITTRVVLNDRRRDTAREGKLEPPSYVDPATIVAER
jgi:RNA polymerase sigma-70 factor (ECF subfamily)